MMTSGSDAQALVEALRARRRADVNRHAAALLRQRARLGAQWRSVANALLHNGEATLAIEAMTRFVEETGSPPQARFQQAALLAELGRLETARAIVADLPERVVGRGPKAHFLGTCAMELGAFDDAVVQFERALGAMPAAGETWLSLAAILDRSAAATLVDRLAEVRSAFEGATPESRASYCYANGIANDAMDDRAAAFGAFAEGAALVRARRPYDADADRRQADRIITGDAEISSAMPTHDAPIFVLGLPRSGTTLVERLLSDAEGDGAVAIGEANLLRIVAEEARGTTAHHVAGRTDELKDLFQHLFAERIVRTGAQTGERRVIDKSLNNSRYLELITTLFPSAPIIWVRRRPIDAAWSCFRTYFNRGVGWSWSLQEIAAHFRIEDQLFEFWQRQLPGTLLPILYEELVAEPEVVNARMRAHCRLPMATSTAREGASPAAVRTASVAQVRRPITRAAIGAAEPYRAYLRPLVEALGV